MAGEEDQRGWLGLFARGPSAPINAVNADKLLTGALAYGNDPRSLNRLYAGVLREQSWPCGPLKFPFASLSTAFADLPPIPALRHYAHGFGWLRDLSAGERFDVGLALDLARSWFFALGTEAGETWQPGMVGLRIKNLLCWGRALFESDDADLRADLAAHLARCLSVLQSQPVARMDGAARLSVAIAKILLGTCLPDLESERNAGLATLEPELKAQILADGSHPSRNPEILSEILFDLTLVEELLLRRGLDAPLFLLQTGVRIHNFLCFVLDEDGGLPIVQGASEGDRAALARAMSRFDPPKRRFGWTRISGFQRLDAQDLHVLMDVANPPDPPYAQSAQPAVLSFTLSSRAGRIVTSCGLPDWADRDYRARLSCSAAHSTLILDDQDSAKLADPDEYAPELNRNPIIPKRLEEPDQVWVEAQHEFWRRSSGLVHRRRLYVDQKGYSVRGEDSLLHPLVDGRPAAPNELIPFAIRFHLAPGLRAEADPQLKTVTISGPGPEIWRFRTNAERLGVEPDAYFGDMRGRQATLQIVLYGMARPDGSGNEAPNHVLWAFSRLG